MQTLKSLRYLCADFLKYNLCSPYVKALVQESREYSTVVDFSIAGIIQHLQARGSQIA